MSAKAAAREILKASSIVDSKRESDTIRLWESYRDQATLWRAISLIQMPTTCLAILLACYLWTTRQITLNVPARPLPGIYAAQDIPDTEFIDTSTEFLNLIASYQHNVAERQFKKAAEMLKEPMLTTFTSDIMPAELQTIRNTNRTQLFFVDPAKSKIDRSQAGKVIVEMTGDRLKIIGGKELPTEKTKFIITLEIVPRNSLNPYGIVISDFMFENVKD